MLCWGNMLQGRQRLGNVGGAVEVHKDRRGNQSGRRSWVVGGVDVQNGGLVVVMLGRSGRAGAYLLVLPQALLQVVAGDLQPHNRTALPHLTFADQASGHTKEHTTARIPSSTDGR